MTGPSELQYLVSRAKTPSNPPVGRYKGPPDPNIKAFTDGVLAAIKGRHTIEQLRDAMGVHQSTIERFRDGYAGPKARTAARAALRKWNLENVANTLVDNTLMPSQDDDEVSEEQWLEEWMRIGGILFRQMRGPRLEAMVDELRRRAAALEPFDIDEREALHPTHVEGAVRSEK